MGRPKLVLASASPGRRRTLQAAGMDPEVVVSGVDESSVDDGPPGAICARLAELKAQAVAGKLRRGETAASGEKVVSGGSPHGDRVLVLGCDSVLAFQGEILGKPAGPAEAVARWRRMRGRHGELYTGHALVLLYPGHPDDGRTAAGVAVSRVHFADLSDAEIDAYVATGEPLAVAGGFTIDGLGAPFVERIDGDPGNVIGASLPLLRRLLAEFGIPVTALWRTGD